MSIKATYTMHDFYSSMFMAFRYTFKPFHLYIQTKIGHFVYMFYKYVIFI
ncbi:hypothetical protein HanIR_Chr04g0190581 [Helianthus annuus]|nr:hypothetical protein HanIR_Chr04g0190581 [Helianthus annuus]